MSSVLYLSPSLSPVCKFQDHSRKTHHSKTANKENPCPKFPLDFRISKRNLLNSTGLALLAEGFFNVSGSARAEPESPIESTSSRMSYSRFLQYSDEGAMKKVDLFDNGMVAIAEIYNPVLDRIQRVKFQLPGLPRDLIRKMEEKNVDFAAHPMEVNWGPAILDLLGNLAFPLLLLCSLLLRSSSSNSPGGPNLPFGLGR